MNIEEARQAFVAARDEEYIMTLCIKYGHQILGELICSNEDHTESCAELEKLVEKWELFQRVHGERVKQIEAEAKKIKGQA